MRRFIVLAIALIALCVSPQVRAQSQDLHPLIKALGQGSYSDTEKQINALTATGDPAAAPALEALANGDLYVRKSDGEVFIAKKAGDGYALTDPLTKADAGKAGSAEIDKIKVNNKLRGVLRSALGTLTLLSPNPNTRRDAAQAVFVSRDPDSIELLDGAIAKEKDAGIAKLMQEARAAAVLNSDRPDEDKLAAIAIIKTRGDQDSLAILTNVANASEGAVQKAANTAVTVVEGELALWDIAQNVWYGLSLGSVLLLAAIGLAITFGVMGVINMAHGEMVMLGAYTTFVVQEIIRNHAPGLFEWSLAIALPLAFVVAGGVGVIIERTVIRFLYGRPLETLLATWGISLILQQAVRTIFGPNNRQVGTPRLDVGRHQCRQPHHHLQPHVDHRLRHRRLRRADDRAEAHIVRAEDARRHPEPDDGGCDGHSHPADRRHDLRPRLGHRRYRRRGAVADRQRQSQPRPGLHHRLFPGGRLRRRR